MWAEAHLSIMIGAKGISFKKSISSKFCSGRVSAICRTVYRDRMGELQRGRDQGHPHRLNTKRQELEVAYQQTAGAIAGLYEFAPQEEVEAPEMAENGQAPELELAEA